ncbi:ATP-dependent Clp protease ATP-binding subunit ClpX [bacterium]|nr:ATP-dependent Clp protease ATP-binding subunit ClpX [bacterium]
MEADDERYRLAEDIYLTPRQIHEEMCRFVIGQERAKRVMSVAAYNHLKRIRQAGSLLRKSNILMIGPTGSGKTHIARSLARILSVPFVVVNATEYTEAGYYGKDVEVMAAELLFSAGGDVRAAERGIIFVDEIDKLARRGEMGRTGAGGRDIGGEGVQQALLKLLESNRVFVPLNVTQHWSKHDFVPMDVSNILFVCAGTFSDLKRGRTKDDIGFAGTSAERKLRRRATVQDLEEYGLISELMGRLPVLTELDPLTDVELGRIVTEPPDALLREFREMFAFEDIELGLEESGLREIVQLAKARKTGARGLRSIFEEVFHDLAFEAPESVGKKVVVDRDYVRAHVPA